MFQEFRHVRLQEIADVQHLLSPSKYSLRLACTVLPAKL